MSEFYLLEISKHLVSKLRRGKSAGWLVELIRIFRQLSNLNSRIIWRYSRSGKY